MQDVEEVFDELLDLSDSCSSVLVLLSCSTSYSYFEMRTRAAFSWSVVSLRVASLFSCFFFSVASHCWSSFRFFSKSLAATKSSGWVGIDVLLLLVGCPVEVPGVGLRMD